MPSKLFLIVMTLLTCLGTARAAEPTFFSLEEIAEKVAIISSTENKIRQQKVEWCTIERQGTEAAVALCGRENDRVLGDVGRFREELPLIRRVELNRVLQRVVDEIDVFSFAFGPKSERMAKK